MFGICFFVFLLFWRTPPPVSRLHTAYGVAESEEACWSAKNRELYLQSDEEEPQTSHDYCSIAKTAHGVLQGTQSAFELQCPALQGSLMEGSFVTLRNSEGNTSWRSNHDGTVAMIIGHAFLSVHICTTL